MTVKRNEGGGHDRRNKRVDEKFPLATWLVSFLNCRYPVKSHSSAVRELSAVQEEVRLKLSPLWGDAKDDEITPCLQKLISEANQGARPRYTITPAHRARRGHDQRKLRIKDQYWVINRSSFGEDLRGEIFRSIVSAMEQNELGRVRLCLQCKKYFVAKKDLRRKICSDICKKAHNKEVSAASMRTFRKNKRIDNEKLKQAEISRTQAQREDVGFRGFSQFMTLRKNWNAKTENAVGALTKKIPGRTSTLREWDKRIAKGESLENLWTRFPEELRSEFIEFHGNVTAR